MAEVIAACPTCGFPVSATHPGQTAACVNCGEKMEAYAVESSPSKGISISGVEIPTPLFVGGLGFLIGVFVGPALIASTETGRTWLEKKARRIGG